MEMEIEELRRQRDHAQTDTKTVDIVGGVDPLPSYPPVEIVIASTNRYKNCSSSSNSSSESG